MSWETAQIDTRMILWSIIMGVFFTAFCIRIRMVEDRADYAEKKLHDIELRLMKAEQFVEFAKPLWYEYK